MSSHAKGANPKHPHAQSGSKEVKVNIQSRNAIRTASAAVLLVCAALLAVGLVWLFFFT